MVSGNVSLTDPNSPQSFSAIRQVDYYVDGALGNDLNDGSQANPFATIGRAIMASDDIFNPGFNSVFVNAGTYAENLVIDDADRLDIRGIGATPHSVIVDGMGTTVADISGSNVSIIDMVFTNGDTGINADLLNRLYLENVSATFNLGNGLHANNVQNVFLINSDFLNNSEFGARVETGNLLRAIESNFHSNGGSGLAVKQIAETRIVSSGGFGNGSLTLDDLFDWIETSHGLAVYGVANLNVVGCNFSENQKSGIVAVNTWDATFVRVNAARNGLNGFYSSFISELDIRRGNFINNGTSGAQIELASYGGSGTPTEQLTIIGSLFKSNTMYGLDIESVTDVSLASADARGNRLASAR